ncbi:MAG: replicative DNA helicase [Hyphomicrobiales bacterium]|nr:replicative DNA helicase [Hyphomicrobiales bacterium]|tara:strand:+ start:2961 stop:4454 length:1494 start_codon:yes stop_codon:yes gene_type:complete
MALNIQNISKSSEAIDYKQMPHNIEAEQQLLGALLINNDLYDKISVFLKPEHFYENVHTIIFELISKLILSNKLASPITLKNLIDQDERFNDLEGSKYLVRLAAENTSIINIEEYGRIIYHLFTWRNLINIGNEIVNVSYSPPAEISPFDHVEYIEQELYGLAESEKYGSDFKEFSTALTEAIDTAASAYNKDGNTSGLASGFRDLDELLGGLQSSDLLIVAGRPSMGKTAFATNIAFHIASKYQTEDSEGNNKKSIDGAVVGFFSLEMSSSQLATRIISEQTEVQSEKIRRGKINKHEYEKLIEVARKLQDIPLYIDETGGISISQLVARARKLKRQNNLGLLIIDYLQLLTSSNRRYNDNRVQELSEITQSLKALAKELNIPIIALSQLSRQVENRDDKKPQLSDLRESGSIEQDADIVMFIYREEYYLQRKEPKVGTEEHLQWQENMTDVHQLAEVILGKNRHGPTNTVKMHFDGSLTRFSDYTADEKLPERFE